MPLDSGDHFRGSKNEYADFQTPKSHYEVLGINKNATEEDINKAYRNILKNGLHEDKIMAMPEGVDRNIALKKLEATKEALRVLTNRRLRAQYDGVNHPPDYKQPTPKSQPKSEYDHTPEERADYEIAQIRLKRADTYEQAVKVIEEYNKQSSDVDFMSERIIFKGDFFLDLNEGEYLVNKLELASNPKINNLSLLKLEPYKKGQRLKVKRSNGEIEDDWEVNAVQSFTEGPQKHLVLMHKIGQENTFKLIHSLKLRELNKN